MQYINDLQSASPSVMARVDTVINRNSSCDIDQKTSRAFFPTQSYICNDGVGRHKGCVLTNCLLCSSLFFMNFRVLMVHDFSAMVAGVDAHQLLVLFSE